MMAGQKELAEGMALPDSIKTIKQENINLYAEASRDFNPIHLDAEFAQKTELGGIVAHGMLILGVVSSYMTANFGKIWLTDGAIDIRFKTAARPGDTITTGGRVTKIEKRDSSSTVFCNIQCKNQKDEAVIIGEARINIQETI